MVEPGRPVSEDLGVRAVRSFLWAALSFGANRFVVFLSTLVLARLLAPADFGLVAAGLTIIYYLEVGLDLGVTSAVIYEQEAGVTERVHTAFTLNLIICSFLTALFVASAPWMARFFHVAGHANLFRVLAGYLLLRGAGQICDALLQRDLLFGKRTIAGLVRAGIRAAVSIGLAVAGAGAWSIVAGVLAGEAVGTIMVWRISRYHPRLTLHKDAVMSLLKFGVSVTAVDLLSEVGVNVDYLVVGNVLGTVALGYYTMAFRFPELLVHSMLWVFSTVAFPVYSKSRAESTEALRAAMLRALALTTFFGFTVGTGLAIVSRDAVFVLLGTKWTAAAGPMALISLAGAIGAIGYASGDIFKAVGKPGVLLAMNGPGTAMVVVAFIVAGPHGIVAVAAVHLVYNALYATARLLVANRFVSSTMSDVARSMLPAVATTAGIVVCALPVRLMTHAGVLPLLATLAAGTLGGFAGLAIGGRDMIVELRSITRQIVNR